MTPLTWRSHARRHCAALGGVLLTLVSLGCETRDSAAISALNEGAELLDPAALAAEQARLDSIAAWNAKFGDRVPRPDSIRGLYVNGWAAGSRSRMRDLIRIADETEINAFVIDIKESDTYLTHSNTTIPLAIEIGAHERPASTWLPELIDTLKAHSIYPIARIVVFKDRMLAAKRPDLAIQHINGGSWKDQQGNPWVDPYNRTVWDYNIAIAREALEMGFSEVQWDYVRFPDVPSSMQRTMSFPAAAGRSREDAIREFVEYSRDQLSEYQVPITADVFGLVTHVEGDVGIGQQWEKLIRVADALLPMVYPSHYYTGMYGFAHPNANPYEIVRVSMEDAVERTRYLQEEGATVGEIRPWLQAMSATWVDDLEYGPAHLREQIQATYDAGLKSWVLWNPGSQFQKFVPALRGDDGSLSPLERGGWTPPRWDPPRSRLSLVIRRRDAAAAEAERLAAAAMDSACAERLAGAEPVADGASC